LVIKVYRFKLVNQFIDSAYLDVTAQDQKQLTFALFTFDITKYRSGVQLIYWRLRRSGFL